MNDFADERRYAWRMIRAARQAQATGLRVDGDQQCRDEVIALLDQALDAGLDRAELVIELANLGGRFLALCDLQATVAYDIDPDDAEICLN